MLNPLKKILRFAAIYGPRRALVKAWGRKRWGVRLPNFSRDRHISFAGCGQFAFSTMAYFLYFGGKRQFEGCFDVEKTNAQTLANGYGFKMVYKDFESLINTGKTRLLYIASNHATHSEYAVAALKKNIDVYIEKPVAVNAEQFQSLKTAVNAASARVFVGYNRPFSNAVRYLSKRIRGNKNPISLNCFIAGHKIEPGHWYRNSKEGTRVCGNLGHWIDLAVHLFNQRGHIPRNFQLTVTYSDASESDDNIAVGIGTDHNDIVSILLTSRNEPFEGINETINFQCGELTAKIDDFRKMTVWNQSQLKKFRYWPKDVGHKRAIRQPFQKEKTRDFREIECSTLLMLKIKDMVLSGAREGELSFS